MTDRLHTAEEWEIRCREAEARAIRAETAYAQIKLAALLEQEDRRRAKSPVAPSGGGRPRGTSGAGEPAPLVDDQVVAGVWCVVLVCGALMLIGAVTLIGWVTTWAAGVIA